jgi:F pilus assembly protein of type IV secretion system
VFTLQKSNKKASSRRQINIKGVRDGVLMLPGNRYRLILEVSSVNFELKSEDEQDAITETYQSFLNSLTTPVQVLVRIREMDMQKYIGGFEAKIAEEKEKVYRDQIRHYTEFVQGLVTTNKILSRHFYIVIPHTDKDGDGFDAVQEQLSLNADLVAKSLSRLGIQARVLDSLEALDLFYAFYSPKRAKHQPLTDQTLQLLQKSYL